MVDLGALSDAIAKVSAERDVATGGIQSLRSTFNIIEDHWQSPAGSSFVGLVANFNSVADRLMAVLDDAISRMRTAHQNYAATEAANTRNLQDHHQAALLRDAVTQKNAGPAPTAASTLRTGAVAHPPTPAMTLRTGITVPPVTPAMTLRTGTTVPAPTTHP